MKVRGDTYPISAKFSMIAGSAVIDLGEGSMTGAYTATPAPFTGLSLDTGSCVKKVFENCPLDIKFKITNKFDSNGKVELTVPTDMPIVQTSACSASIGGVTTSVNCVSNNAGKFIIDHGFADTKNIAGEEIIVSFASTGFKNPPSSKPTSPIVVTSF